MALYAIVLAGLVAMAVDSASFGHKMTGMQFAGAGLIMVPGVVFDVINKYTS